MQTNGTVGVAGRLVASKFIPSGVTPYLCDVHRIGFAAAAQGTVRRRKEEYRFDVKLQRKLHKVAHIQVLPTLRRYPYSTASNVNHHGLSTLHL
jgi:hypothetical protein